ncbi:MAG: hypothetical protein A2189_05240 [Paenibacillus sp. RIFOXYA1_FULL_44_5]|nr:MAG: hypothetical protein A2189_05240 [Paenibacillus sp. RIFOXYA1_FULL_44_5]
MGHVNVQEAHESRSSSMSFALRWKHENPLKILSVVLILLVLSFMLVVLWHGTNIKYVTVVIGGQEKLIKTNEGDLQSLLKTQGIAVGAQDRISKPLDSRLVQGEKVVISHTTPIQVTADGKTEMLYTIGKTISAALNDLNIPVGKEDIVDPAMDSPISDRAAVKIVRVKKVEQIMTESIPFKTITENTAKMLKGKQQIVQPGAEGLVQKKIQMTYEDEVLVSEKPLDETVFQQSMDQIVAVGTLNPVEVLSASSPNVDEVTKDGVTFGVKRILSNVVLTAYASGYDSTGKNAGDPLYGITYTGTHVQQGQTIAVDPKVIPLGWWVYIDGIGFRRAEDIGSGVKGKWIDIYYDSMDYANSFGMKRGAKVYIIGKNKPSAN